MPDRKWGMIGNPEIQPFPADAVVNPDLEFAEALSRAARVAPRLAGVETGAVVLADASGTLTIQAASARFPPSVQTEWRGQRGDGLVGKVVQEGRPFVTGDLRASASEALPFGPTVPVRALIILPLKGREQILGCLIVAASEVRRFSPEQVEGLTRLASRVSIVIERVWRRQAEEQISQAERLRTIGGLARGIAHEFSSLLAIILGRAQLLLLQGQLAPEAVQQLQTIEQAALEGARTVRRIQEFSRPAPSRRYILVDLGQLLDEVKVFTRPRWEKEAQAAGFSYDVQIEAEPLPLIRGDPERLREAFTNLLLNALEAMPRGGRVRFGAARDGPWVRVTVHDTGEGMTVEVRRRAFEPLFTTKGLRGSGLGLSVVWGVVQRHAGEITVDTQPGRGTTVTVRLPVGTAAVPPEPRPPRPTSPRAAKILLIDDDAAVRAVLREMLELHGHTVVEAGDGATGLAQGEAEPFDLVLTDLVMPGMSGWEVAATLKSRAPDRPVGLVTGWSSQLHPDKMKGRPVDFVLAKPFRFEDVLRRLAEHLP